MITYAIEDWAGNLMFGGKEFESFDDAWDFLYEKFPDDRDLEEFEVVQVEYPKRAEIRGL